MAPSESAAQTPTQVLPRGPGVLRFAVAGFCNALSTGFFYPFSLLFYVSLSGEELRTVGTVLTVTALAALPSLLLVGRIVDRVGPRPVLIASLVVRAGCFVSFVTFGAPPRWPSARWPWPSPPAPSRRPPRWSPCNSRPRARAAGGWRSPGWSSTPAWVSGP